MLEKPVPPTTNIGQAYQYFRDRLAGCDGNDESIDPRRVLETLERRLMVVSINLGDADDPYLIFESLNFKGSPLTQADLVRNYYLMRLPVNDQQRIHDDLWLPMQKRLGNDLTEFMRRYVTLRTAEDVRKGEIYADLKKLLSALSPKDVEESLADMARYSGYYVTFIHPEQEPDPRAREVLSHLARWEAETTYPFLMRVAELRQAGAMSAADYVRTLEAIESFIIRRSMCLVSTKQHLLIFIDLAARMPDIDAADWVVKTLAEGLAGRRWPTDEEFKRHWVSSVAYVSRQDRCKLLLEALEKSFGHKEPGAFANATIEHVMPQTLTPEWQAVQSQNADEDWSKLVDTIGNLTLSGYNAELSNASFAKKKQIYKTSHFELNSYFAAVKRWDAQAIRARAEALWEHARKIWWRPAS
ncbi:MAG: DUF262 domain-containing protein [Gemmataceae bacterium]|nr:DUF262 domain-containing protein [Gemmataceae bacterium]